MEFASTSDSKDLTQKSILENLRDSTYKDDVLEEIGFLVNDFVLIDISNEEAIQNWLKSNINYILAHITLEYDDYSLDILKLIRGFFFKKSMVSTGKNSYTLIDDQKTEHFMSFIKYTREEYGDYINIIDEVCTNRSVDGFLNMISFGAFNNEFKREYQNFIEEVLNLGYFKVTKKFVECVLTRGYSSSEYKTEFTPLMKKIIDMNDMRKLCLTTTEDPIDFKRGHKKLRISIISYILWSQLLINDNYQNTSDYTNIQNYLESLGIKDYETLSRCNKEIFIEISKNMKILARVELMKFVELLFLD